MQHLLSRASRPVLMQLAGENTLCGFDFDGTLSPIVKTPDRAGMRVRTRELLGRVAGLYPSVIVSGRSRADLLTKLGGIKVASVIGNHGAETGAATIGSRALVEGWIAALESRLGPSPGLWLEDKGLSVAVHYRQCPAKAEIRRRVLEATRDLPEVRVLGGKQVVNLMLACAPDKGEALATERAKHGCDWVLYVGDDENDEDAFALSGNVVPVRVGRKQRSNARYYLTKQAEIDELLHLLVQLRTAAVGKKRA
jgi:trehalose 6-phosphate phosphatase